MLIGVPILWSRLYTDSKELYNKIINLLDLKNGETVEIDFKHKIHHNQKLLINGANYLIVNSNADQVKLKPVSPVFLKQDSIKYLNAAIKYQSNYKNFDGDSFSVILNRDGTSVFEINKDKNTSIINELISIASKNKYDYCPMISAVRSYTNELEGKTLSQQIDFISSTILLFGRKSDLVKKNLRKSKAALFNEKIYIIYESVTGLENYKKEL